MKTEEKRAQNETSLNSWILVSAFGGIMFCIIYHLVGRALRNYFVNSSFIEDIENEKFLFNLQ